MKDESQTIMISDRQIRIQEVDKERWFCLRDLCVTLNLNKIDKNGKINYQTNKIISKIPNDYRYLMTTNSRGELRKTAFVNKRGIDKILALYRSNIPNDVYERFIIFFSRNKTNNDRCCTDWDSGKIIFFT